MRHAELLFNVTGQTLYLDPPELSRASAPSATVYELAQDDDGPTESAIGAASVDSVDTTLTADVLAGSVELSLDSTTGIHRKGRYLLTGADGLAEHVDVIAVGTTVRVQRPLVNDYATGAAFQGTRISATVDSTWVGDSTNTIDGGYRVRWTYTIDGATQLAVTYFDLVRYSARALVTAQDVDSRFPGWIDRLPPDHRENQGASLIDSAFQAVKLDALGDSQILRRLRDSQIIRELTIVKANLLAVENQIYAGGGNLDGLTAARNLYTQRYQQLVREPKAPSDELGGGGASEPVERLAVWRR